MHTASFGVHFGVHLKMHTAPFGVHFIVHLRMHTAQIRCAFFSFG
jgi:hypothetical protein